MQTTLSGVEASFAVAVKMPFPCNHRPSGEIELPDEVGGEDEEPGEGGQGLGEVLNRHLVTLLDRCLCSNLNRFVRKLYKPRICEAGVVDVAEHGVEAHLLAVVGPKLHLEAVDHEDPDQPMQLLFGHLIPQFTGVPCHLYAMLLYERSRSKV